SCSPPHTTTQIYTLSLHDALPISEACSNPSHAGRVRSLSRLAAGTAGTGKVPARLAGDCALCDGRPRSPRDPYPAARQPACRRRSEEHTSELQSLRHLVCRLLL